ncbi:TPA: hypothetical protein PTV97_003289 [Clostridium botulinum]|nr:hypothetical protein [Clostridium botulinum]
MLNDKEKENHQCGIDCIEVIKHLYGENYKKINKLRWELFKSLDDTPFEVQRLRLFVQNTIPINKKDIEEFDKLYSKVKEEYDLKKINYKNYR